MTRTLDTFLEEERQKRERVGNLAASITDAHQALTQARTDYEVAVIADDDKETNRLFQEIETLEGQIKADEHKLQTLQAVTDKHLRQSAVDTLRTFHAEVRDKYRKKTAAALEQIEQSKQAYIRSLSVLDGINEAYNAERNEYRPLLHRYGFTRHDIDQRNALYNDIDDPGQPAPTKGSMVIQSIDIEKGLKKL